MDVDDLNEKTGNEECEEELDNIILETAGDYIFGRMLEVFGSSESARKWYFSKMHSLGDISPYKYLRENDHDDERHSRIEDILEKMDYGICP